MKRSNIVLVLDNSMLWISSLVHCIRSSVLLLIIVVKVVKVSLTLYMTYYIGASPACSQVVLSLTVMYLSRFVSYCFCSQAPRIPNKSQMHHLHSIEFSPILYKRFGQFGCRHNPSKFIVLNELLQINAGKIVCNSIWPFS